VLAGCPARGPVFEDDEPRVQNFGIDKFEAHLWIAGIDGLPATAAKDEGKDQKPEAVDDIDYRRTSYREFSPYD